MEFLEISLLGATYRYIANIKKKLKKKKRDFGAVNLKQGKGTPKLQNIEQSQGRVTDDNPLKPQENKKTMKTKKEKGKWREFHKSPTQNTNEFERSSHWWPR